jgi:hypothetical protein
VNWRRDLPAEIWICVLERLSLHDALQWLHALFPCDYLHWRRKEPRDQNALDWRHSPLRHVMEYISRRTANERGARSLLSRHILFPHIPIRLYSRRAPDPSVMRIVVLEYGGQDSRFPRKRGRAGQPAEELPRKRRLLIENEYYMNSCDFVPRTRVRASLTLCETKVEVGAHEITLREFPLACEFLNRICPIAVISIPEDTALAGLETWIRLNMPENLRLCAARFLVLRRALGAVVYMHRARIVDVHMWRNSSHTTERVTTVFFRARQETVSRRSPKAYRWRFPLDAEVKKLHLAPKRKMEIK